MPNNKKKKQNSVLRAIINQITHIIITIKIKKNSNKKNGAY